jgi:hypothetical protein
MRIVFRNSETGESADCGAIWPGRFGNGNFSGASERSTRESGGKTYQTIPFEDALALQRDKKGFINVVGIGGDVGVIPTDGQEDEF